MRKFLSTVTMLMIFISTADAQPRQYPSRCYQRGELYCNTVPPDDYQDLWTVEIQIERGWATVGNYNSRREAEVGLTRFQIEYPRDRFRMRPWYDR